MSGSNPDNAVCTAPSRSSPDSRPLVATDFEIAQFAEKIPGGNEDCGAGRGRLHGTAGADEEGRADFRLERPDALGQSSGREIKTPGRFGKRTAVHDRHERVQESRIHKRP
jgi:hypothetical protein